MFEKCLKQSVGLFLYEDLVLEVFNIKTIEVEKII